LALFLASSAYLARIVPLLFP